EGYVVGRIGAADHVAGDVQSVEFAVEYSTGASSDAFIGSVYRVVLYGQVVVVVAVRAHGGAAGKYAEDVGNVAAESGAYVQVLERNVGGTRVEAQAGDPDGRRAARSVGVVDRQVPRRAACRIRTVYNHVVGTVQLNNARRR